MPKTLEGAKPDFENELNELLYDAAYVAMDSAVNWQADIDPTVQAYANDVSQKMNDAWARAFADKAAPKLADAIYKFVKEIGITMTPSGALMFAQPYGPGPVTGSALMEDFTIV